MLIAWHLSLAPVTRKYGRAPTTSGQPQLSAGELPEWCVRVAVPSAGGPGHRTVSRPRWLAKPVIHRCLWITLLIVWNTPWRWFTPCWLGCGRPNSSRAHTASDLRFYRLAACGEKY